MRRVNNSISNLRNIFALIFSLYYLSNPLTVVFLTKPLGLRDNYYVRTGNEIHFVLHFPLGYLAISKALKAFWKRLKSKKQVRSANGREFQLPIGVSNKRHLTPSRVVFRAIFDRSPYVSK